MKNSFEFEDPIPLESESRVVESITHTHIENTPDSRIKSKKRGKMGGIIAGVTAVTLGALGEAHNVEAADAKPKTPEVKAEALNPEEKEKKIVSNQLADNISLFNNFEDKISHAHIPESVKKHVKDLNIVNDATKVLKDESVPGAELLQEMNAKGDEDLKKIRIARIKIIKQENETLEHVVKTFHLDKEDIRKISDEQLLSKILHISITIEVESIAEFKLIQNFLNNKKGTIEQCDAFIKVINTIDPAKESQSIKEKLEKTGFEKIDKKLIEEKCSAQKSFLLSALDFAKKAAKQR